MTTVAVFLLAFAAGALVVAYASRRETRAARRRSTLGSCFESDLRRRQIDVEVRDGEVRP